MATQNILVEEAHISTLRALSTQAYRIFGYFGIFSIAASLIFGFRFSPEASNLNFAWNVLICGIFVAPHLIMTRAWFKRIIWGNPDGHPRERRVYIFIAVVMWLGLVAWHRPLPGGSLSLPQWVTFCGVVIFLLGFMLFFEGINRSALDGLLGVPGTVAAYSHGPETPLLTEGTYASVRHPMYRSFMIYGLGSLLVHPNVAQLFWFVCLAAAFVAFIPVEEAQLIRARGDEYRAYQRQTPWRLVRGIW